MRGNLENGAAPLQGPGPQARCPCNALPVDLPVRVSGSGSPPLLRPTETARSSASSGIKGLSQSSRQKQGTQPVGHRVGEVTQLE